MQKPLSSEGSRGADFCRACFSENVVRILDLGLSPIANSLPEIQSPCTEPRYPLALSICEDCNMGQIAEFESASDIFSEYPYLSSTSSIWLQHANSFATEVVHRFPALTQGYVLEIASNDGYLLKYFQEKGIEVLGVDPAENVALIAQGNGIPTIPKFFGVSLATEILNEFGAPSLIVANNVAAHVPDMADFFGGIARLCGPNTVVSIENPSLGFLLKNNYYDTIYHEHFSYLSVEPVQKLVKSLGMELFDVETLHTHGGSLRYWISKSGSYPVNRSVDQMRDEESNRGVGDRKKIEEFASQTRAEMNELSTWVNAQPKGSIIGYGAAAKTVTTFFAAGLSEDRFCMIVDASRLKQNRRLPGTQISILSPEVLENSSAAKVLIFPWNLENEIVQTIRDFNPEIEIWIPNPLRKIL